MAKILIIDDDPDVLTMLREMLEREGYEVVAANDGEKGVKCYRDNSTDLIITDIIMPEKEGIETILDLRKEFPDIKIIAISGGGRINATDHLKLAKHIGAQYTFSKPFERKELLRAVRDLIK